MLKAPSPGTDSDVDRYHHGDLRRALLAAALQMLTETQDWDFSLREVARRAGVSHAAPYNHFAGKRDLLVALAAMGYDLLLQRMQEATAHVASASATLSAIGTAYICFGVSNPAHYRLMFGTTLTAGGSDLPAVVAESAAAAQGLLRDTLGRGRDDGSFDIPPTDSALDTAVLSAWALVHGLTTLLVDGLAGVTATPGMTASQSAARIAGSVTQLLLDGLSPKLAR